MIGRNLRALAGAAFLAASGAAFGQRATEVYIPIGKSPGLSGRYTSLGFIQSVDMQTHTLTVAGANRTWTVRLSDESQVFLDRSTYKLPNVYGSHADCQVGLLVEVKFVGRTKPEGVSCDWIKIQPIDPRPERRGGRVPR